jgi:hypothetical protein
MTFGIPKGCFWRELGVLAESIKMTMASVIGSLGFQRLLKPINPEKRNRKPRKPGDLEISTETSLIDPLSNNVLHNSPEQVSRFRGFRVS